MNRRRFLTGAATAGVLAVAGCVDVEDTEYGSEDTAEADEDGDDLPDEDEVENRPEGEDYLEFGGLELTEYELVVEEGEFRDEIYVEGVVENTDGEAFNYAEVSVRAYDAEGRHLNRYRANTTDLGGNIEWAFEVGIREDLEDFDDYDIGITGRQL